MNTLQKVKTALGITGDYQDDTLLLYIQEVKNYLISSGVPFDVIESDISTGVIARGVSDIWNYSGGRFSPYFYQRAVQLKYEGGDCDV